MNIHEYQAKKILKDYGLNVLNGFLVENKEELESAGHRIETDKAVIKAQIHSGGRGKAGGVKLVDSMTDLLTVGEDMLGKILVTNQTGPEGKKVNKLYIEESCAIDREFYLSLVIDRKTSLVTVIFSKHGGMDIEEVAESNPSAVLSISVDPVLGLKGYQIREVAQVFELDSLGQITKTLNGMVRAFYDLDCSMIEINPLVLTEEKELIILDAKMSFDTNSMYRQNKIELLRDFSEEVEEEVEAASYGLSYVSLEGEIGCLVNGAGLAMATMDAIYQAGGKPANFLDVGGSASIEQVSKACKITASKKNVKGIFVNIFGGIMHCDTVAKGIVDAFETIDIPVVVRLEGTNIDEGRKILEASDVKVQFASNMNEGADLIVKCVGGQNEYMG